MRNRRVDGAPLPRLTGDVALASEAVEGRRMADPGWCAGPAGGLAPVLGLWRVRDAPCLAVARAAHLRCSAGAARVGR